MKKSIVIFILSFILCLSICFVFIGLVNIKVLKSENLELTETNTTLTNNITTLENEKVELTIQVDGLNSEKLLLKTNITELTAEKNSLSENLTIVTTEKEALELEITSLNNQITTLNSTIETKNTEIANLNARIDELENSEDIDSLLITELRAEIESLENQVNTLTNEKATLQTNLNNVIAEKNELETEVITLTNQITALNNTIAEKESTITSLNATIETKNAEITTLQARITELENQSGSTTTNVKEAICFVHCHGKDNYNLIYNLVFRINKENITCMIFCDDEFVYEFSLSTSSCLQSDGSLIIPTSYPGHFNIETELHFDSDGNYGVPFGSYERQGMVPNAWSEEISYSELVDYIEDRSVVPYVDGFPSCSVCSGWVTGPDVEL